MNLNTFSVTALARVSCFYFCSLLRIIVIIHGELLVKGCTKKLIYTHLWTTAWLHLLNLEIMLLNTMQLDFMSSIFSISLLENLYFCSILFSAHAVTELFQNSFFNPSTYLEIHMWNTYTWETESAENWVSTLWPPLRMLIVLSNAKPVNINIFVWASEVKGNSIPWYAVESQQTRGTMHN